MSGSSSHLALYGCVNREDTRAKTRLWLGKLRPARSSAWSLKTLQPHGIPRAVRRRVPPWPRAAPPCGGAWRLSGRKPCLGHEDRGLEEKLHSPTGSAGIFYAQTLQTARLVPQTLQTARLVPQNHRDLRPQTPPKQFGSDSFIGSGPGSRLGGVFSMVKWL